MAPFRNFTGFESGLLTVLGQTSLNNTDGFLSVEASGRSGRYALRFTQTVVGLGSANVQLVTPGHAATPAPREAGAILRVFIRLLTYPSADKIIAFWSGPTDISSRVEARITSTGTFKVRAVGVDSAESAVAIPLNQWVELQLATFIHNDSSASAVDDYNRGSLTILGETVSVCKNGSEGYTTAQFSFGAAALGDAAASAVTVDLLYDDWFYIADDQAGPAACAPAGTCSCLRAMTDIPTVTLPTETTVVPAYPTAQGSLADWVGAYSLVTELPFDATNGASEQTEAGGNGGGGVSFADDFEDGQTLAAAGYTNIITAETEATSGNGGGWGVRTTGTASQKYYGEFSRDGLAPTGPYGSASADYDHAFDDDNGNGFYAMEVRRVSAFALSLYHGVGADRRTVQLYDRLTNLLGEKTGAVTPDVFQRLALSWRMSSAPGVADGSAIVTVDGVVVISVTNVTIDFPASVVWDTVVFGPMGHLDNIQIGDGPSTTFDHGAPFSVVRGVRVLAMWKAAIAASHALLWNGDEYSVAVKAAYLTLPQPTQVIWGNLTPAEFTAREFGVRNKTGATMQLGAILLEVLGIGRLGATPGPTGHTGRWLAISGPGVSAGSAPVVTEKWVPFGAALPVGGSVASGRRKWVPLFGPS